MMVGFEDIQQARARIASAVVSTPIVSSSLLNRWLGHDIYFKAECLQRTGAFKIRGATNFIRHHLENHSSPPSLILANSSGNHAQAVARAGKEAGIDVHIYASANISPIKAAATRDYGAELFLFEDRNQADTAIEKAVASIKNAVWIPPFNHPDIIAGQGTAAAEALEQIDDVDAVFVPCGGGGLTAGTLIAARHRNSSMQVVAAEPKNANDAAQSLRLGKIVKLTQAPQTLADGAATPSVGTYTFPFLQQLDDLIEVDENNIIYWTQWLHHLLKLHIEPTCAMTMHAVTTWLKTQKQKKRILVMLSGGNISAHSMQQIWQSDRLEEIPSL